MEELKPCPFCGGKISRQIGFGGLNFFKCLECGVVISFDNDYYNTHRNEAIAAWNCRAEPENKPLTVEQLKNMPGEVVWVVLLNIAKPVSCEIITEICKDGIRTVSANGNDYASFGLYGKTWLAYARKPEGSENNGSPI